MRGKDLTGKVFGRLTVVGLNHTDARYQRYWKVHCSCRTHTIVRGDHLTNAKIKSCGCLRQDTSTKHGMSHTSTYRIWKGMIQRCHNNKAPGYSNYGDRGILVCDRWKKFENFFADMGERPEGMSIERIDNDGNYEPSNCKWVTKKEQERNKRNNRLITYQGATKTLAEWAELSGVNYNTLQKRLKTGCSLVKVFFRGKFKRGELYDARNL